ncbi:hypothetical protein PPTG_14226 [Phytophthora nicotianae INRA-310]|uniref:Ubiquitin-like protease family profile domain-containing protein n=1 Tax=Phytophthora nicotianae (strain INRA-310) TaxID=761204 RepID=W2PXX7_PHYN3|nr:hypothetical protein PPTG_14226 [Phytophthora nicotianae INRA-310]ETN05506.1 hypothetical protein PPTG_14226 [Phytophthora nicotianae INRA-310]
MVGEFSYAGTSCRLRIEFVTLSGEVNSREKCLSLSSLSWELGWPRTPSTPLGEYEYIINPVNMRASHWDIIVIRLTYVDTPKKILRVQVYMYEPLMDEEYHDDLEVVMKGVAKDDEKNIAEKEGIRGFLERWHAATADNVPLIINPVEWIKAPEQPDGSSCGVLGGGSGPQLSYWKHEAANLQCFEE